MGATINIGDRASTYNVTDSDAAITLAKGDAITVDGGNGIFQGADANSDAIGVNGEIHVAGANGLRIGGFGNTITLGFDSIVTGSIGLWLDNNTATELDGNEVISEGQIVATSQAIRNEDQGTSILNFGTLAGEKAVVGLTYGLTLANKELATVDGDSRGIDLSGISDLSQQSTIVNDGTISGDTAIAGGDEQEKVTNRGKITGDVLLGGGSDLFDNRGGSVDGLIEGGDGNDTFIVDKSDTSLREDAAGGTGDTVESTVSFTLAANFENLFLLGSAKANAVGNAEDNNIHGGSGSNILKGRGGDDLLFGEKGNDILLGGGGVDHFVFEKGSGHDTIRDFAASGQLHDIVDLSDFTGIADFSALKKHHLEERHGDVVIDLGHGDAITIADTAKADLHAGDFLFVPT